MNVRERNPGQIIFTEKTGLWKASEKQCRGHSKPLAEGFHVLAGQFFPFSTIENFAQIAL